MRKKELLSKGVVSYTTPNIEVYKSVVERGFAFTNDDVDQDYYEW